MTQITLFSRLNYINDYIVFDGHADLNEHKRTATSRFCHRVLSIIVQLNSVHQSHTSQNFHNRRNSL